MSLARTEDDAPRGFVPRSDLYNALRRLDAAIAERDELQAKLDAITGADLVVRIAAAGFHRCEAQILAAMWARPIQPSAAIIEAYSPSRSNEDSDVGNLVKVRICTLRKRAKALGCPVALVRTIYASGYALTDEGRQWLSNRVYEAIGERIPELFEKGAAR